MDILSLSSKATAEANPAFGPQKGLKVEFADSFAGAKGLAPPGPEPPPIALIAKSGEEGATPEPIAPTQNPDFSPDLNQEIDPGDPNILIDFDLPAIKPKEPVKVGDLKPSDDSAECLQTFVCLGVISVPYEELRAPTDLSADSIQSKPTVKTEQGWTGSRSSLLSDNAIAPFRTNGQGPKPSKEDAQKGIPVDFPTKPDPILEMPQPFNGERPKKLIDPTKASEKSPVVTPKPWTDASAGPVVLVNGSRPQKHSDDAVPVKQESKDQVQKTDQAANISRPRVINLGTDVDLKQPIQELPGHPQSNVTDPFIPEKPSQGEVKEPTKGVPTADEAKPADPTKGDPTKSGSEQNVNRPLRPIPKPEIKPASEKEEVKIRETESKPSAEAIARPRPIASDSVPQKPDLTPKQADEVVRQVLDRIDALAASKGRKVTVHLDPKEFGSITLVVGRRGGEVDAEIYASNDRVRQALETNRPNLAAGLDQRGIQLSSMTVGSELPHGSGRQEQAMHDLARQHHPNMSRFERPETTTLSLDAIRGLARKASGVDLWI